MIECVILYFVCGVISYLLMYDKTSDALNPIGLLNVIWFFTAALASTLLGFNQKRWSFETILIVLIAGITSVSVGYFNCKPKEEYINFSCEKYVNSTYKLLTRAVWLVCMLIVSYVLIRNGFNLYTDGTTDYYDLKTSVQGFTFTNNTMLNWFILYIPYTALNSIFELVYSRKEERDYVYNYIVILFAIFYSWRIIYSRGTLLIIAMGALFIINCKRKLSIKLLLIIGVVLIAGLYFLMTIRLAMSSYVFQGAFNSPMLNSTYNYLAYGFQNLDSIINNGSGYEIVKNTWRSLYGVFNSNVSTQVYAYQVAGRTVTYLGQFFDDLGIIGIILYPGLISYVLMKLYNNRNRLYEILVLGSLQKAIFSIFFAYILTYLLCRVSKKVLLLYPRIGFSNRNNMHSMRGNSYNED